MYRTALFAFCTIVMYFLIARWLWYVIFL